MDYNNKIQLKAILNYLRSASHLRQFEYYDKFYKKWNKILNYYFKNDCFFCNNNFSDLDQAYHYDYPFYDIKLTFDFSIAYINNFFNKNKGNFNMFPQMILSNIHGELMFEGSICEYTYYNLNECKENYDNMDEIFIIPFPSYPLRYVVIDGNHRLSLQVNQGKQNIKARFCPIEICERSLISASQIVTYSFLFDCAFIQNNIKKISDLQLKKHLKIFDESSFLNNLDERIQT